VKIAKLERHIFAFRPHSSLKLANFGMKSLSAGCGTIRSGNHLRPFRPRDRSGWGSYLDRAGTDSCRRRAGAPVAALTDSSRTMKSSALCMSAPPLLTAASKFQWQDTTSQNFRQKSCRRETWRFMTSASNVPAGPPSPAFSS
jgi:hypothetical protein